MNKNLVSVTINSLESIFKEQEKRIGGRYKNYKDSYFITSKRKSDDFMSLILGYKADSLSMVDIKEFNKKIFSKIFTIDDEKKNNKNKNDKEDLYQSTRWYLSDNRQIIKYFPIMQTKLLNHFNENKSLVIDGIEKALEEECLDNIITYNDKGKGKYTTNGKKFIQSINSKIDNTSKYQLKDDLTEFQINDSDINFSFAPTLTEEGLKNSKDEIINPFLKEVQKIIGQNTSAQTKAQQYLEQDAVKEQFTITLKDYNTTIYISKLFYGFWGESLLGSILEKIVSDSNLNTSVNSVEQIGNKKSIRDTGSYLLPQAPADTLLTIDGKKYRFQAKQWSLDSFAGKNSYVEPLGARSLNYNSKSKNWQYFYNYNTWNNNIIPTIEGEENSKSSLPYITGAIDTMVNYFNSKSFLYFKHLTLGSFNFETQLPYKETLVAGNDFFYLSGRFIPAVFLLKQFLNALNDNTEPLIVVERKTTEENSKTAKTKKNFNYMSVSIKGLKIDLNHLANKTIALNF